MSGSVGRVVVMSRLSREEAVWAWMDRVRGSAEYLSVGKWLAIVLIHHSYNNMLTIITHA